MANLNLSEFTEKTLVADADWVFVWDTAGAISKKVSRNSLLNSGTLATSAPVTISQTWDALAVAFTAFKVNATSTNSAAGSLLLDLQFGGVTQFNVTKAGAVTVTGSITTPAQFIAGDAIFANGNGVRFVSAWIRSAGFDGGILFRNNAQNQTVGLAVDADNTLALRNGAAAQTFNVYGTYTASPLAYERLTISATGGTSGNAIIGTNKTGTGVLARGLEFQTDGVTRMTIPSTAATVDFTNGIKAGNGSTSVFQNANCIALQFTGSTYGGSSLSAIVAISDGVLRVTNGGTTDFNRFQLGGTTDAFPAIARDGAGIKFTGAAAGLTSHIKVPAVAVSSLPSATTAGVGARAFVNDASTPIFGSAVTGVGAVAVPVYSTGSAWNVG
jgi:hypothetical protein